MKKISIPACVSLALALVVAVGSVTFLSPCVHEDGSFGSCHWAGQGMLGVGALMAALSLLILFSGKRLFRAAMYFSLALTAVLGLFIPGGLIALCKMSAMRCRAVMQPAMIILFCVALLCAVTGAVMSARK